MIFQFDAVSLASDGWRGRPWALPDLKAVYRRFSEALDVHAWNTVALSSHDEPRVVSTFGDDSLAFRVPSAKALATMLLTQKGTPFVYQGDELAMTNYPFTAIEQFDDIAAKNQWKELVDSGKVPAAEVLAALRKRSRDNSRSPMQWNDSPNAGFTTATKAWLAVNPNYAEINAKSSLADGKSVYHYMSALIALRKKTPALLYGNYKDLDPTHPSVFAYTRTLKNERCLVLLNLSRQEVHYVLPARIAVGRLMLSNQGVAPEHVSEMTLKPWEARVYAF